jgi:signal transduction histidine kinase
MVHFVTCLALLGLVVAGFACIFGVKSLAEKAFGFVALTLGLALGLPLVVAIALHALQAIARAVGEPSFELPSVLPVLFVLGHVALAVVLLRWRFRARETVRRRRDEVERARSRERQRIAPRPEEPAE